MANMIPIDNNPDPGTSSPIHPSRGTPLLAGNIANIDTPGYVAQRPFVDDFQTRLQEAIRNNTTRTRTRPVSRAESARMSIGTAAERRPRAS